MPSDFFFTYHPFQAELVKSASDGSLPPIDDSARAECQDIMNRIYAENPRYWPHGVDVGMLDGGAYILRHGQTKQAMGFAGWQERWDGMKRVGYYAIGVLPEFRGAGVAKSAVAQLIQEKSAGVDEVRAFIVPENAPSLALAKSLGVPVQHKSAAVGSAIRKYGPGVLGALAGGAGTDYIVHEGDYSHFSPARIGMGVFNTVLGGAAGRKIQNGELVSGASLLGLLPAKDLAISSLGPVSKAGPLMEKATQRLSEPPPSNALPLAAGAAGVGGLGYLLYRGLKGLRRPKDTGRVRIKLPRADGTFTEVEMPMEQLVDLPDNVTDALGRDIKRQMRTESRLRTMRRGRDGKLYPLIHEDELEVKAAAAVAPAPAPGGAKPGMPMPGMPMGGAGGGKIAPPMSFVNYAAQTRQQHVQNQASLDAQAQQQAQQSAQMQAEAAKTPPQMPERTAIPALEYATNRAMKAITALQKRADASDPFSTASLAKPKAPTPAAATPSTVAPAATMPPPAPSPAAPTPAPAAAPDPYAQHRQRLTTAGYKNLQQTNNGLLGVDARGNRAFVDSAGRTKYYQMPGAAQPSTQTQDPWYHRYNPISRATYNLMGGEQADHGALKDWENGRPGATLFGDYQGYNPLKIVGGSLEGMLRGYSRGNESALDSMEAIDRGDYSGAWDSAKRVGSEYGANSLDLASTLLPIAKSNQLLRTAGSFGLAGLSGRLGEYNDAAMDPYRITGSDDPRLAAAMGEERSPAKSAPGFAAPGSQLELSMANQGLTPWAYSLPQTSPYANDRMQLANQFSNSPLGSLAASWLMPRLFGDVDQRSLTSPTF